MYAQSLDAPPPPPLRAQLAAFSRPRTSEDQLPPDLDKQVQVFDAALLTQAPAEEVEAKPRGTARLPFLGRVFRRDVDPRIKAELEALGRKHEEEQGGHLPDGSRLLLRDLGVERLHLYAVPTTTGQVGFYLVGREQPRISGSVAAALPEGITWRILYEREPGKPTHLIAFGLVANHVAAVEVELKRERRSAVLANNAFFFEAEGYEPTEVTGLSVHNDVGIKGHISIEH
jgi:hypothetical protein